MVLLAIVAVVTQTAIVGVLVWLVHSFGAFCRARAHNDMALYYEVINMREQNRRLSEVVDTFLKQRSA